MAFREVRSLFDLIESDVTKTRDYNNSTLVNQEGNFASNPLI